MTISSAFVAANGTVWCQPGFPFLSKLGLVLVSYTQRSVQRLMAHVPKPQQLLVRFPVLVAPHYPIRQKAKLRLRDPVVRRGLHDETQTIKPLDQVPLSVWMRGCRMPLHYQAE